MDKLDFYDQLSMATGAGQEESLKKMIESKDMLVSLSLVRTVHGLKIGK